MMLVSLVLPADVPKVWAKIRKYVANVEGMSRGRATVTSIFTDLVQGRLMLWVVFDPNGPNKEARFVAFACTSIKEYPSKRMLHVDFVGGEKVEEWLGIINETLSSFGAAQECVGLEAVGRRGWKHLAKKHGWNPRYTLFEKMFKVPEQLTNLH
jgi:hypothetical protein